MARNPENNELNTQRREEYIKSLPLLKDATQVNPAINTDNIEMPTENWKDKLLKNIQRPSEKEEEKKPASRRSSTSKLDLQEDNFISFIIPMGVSGLIATYVRSKFKEEYKHCAPSQMEISGTILPLFEIIDRHIKASVKVGPDARDIVKSIMSAITLATRVLMSMEETRNGNIGSDNSDRREDKITPIRDIGNISKNSREQRTTDGEHGNVMVHNGSPGNERSDADKVADLFRKDALYRQQLNARRNGVS